jgi:hypothetical protein
MVRRNKVLYCTGGEETHMALASQRKARTGRSQKAKKKRSGPVRR